MLVRGRAFDRPGGRVAYWSTADDFEVWICGVSVATPCREWKGTPRTSVGSVSAMRSGFPAGGASSIRDILPSASADGRVQVWDAATLRRLWLFTGAGPIATAAISSGGEYLASGTTSGVVEVWVGADVRYLACDTGRGD